MTAIEGLHITNLCEDKISVSPAVEKEMLRLRGEGKLDLCLSPIYATPESSIKLSFLNARSLHKHINDVPADINYLSTDISVFSETRFSCSDSDTMYKIGEHILFRNDAASQHNERPYGGTVYTRIYYCPGYPYCCNQNGVEITVMRFMIIPHITVIAIYRSPSIPIRHLCSAIKELLALSSTSLKVFVGDFNVNWLNITERATLYNLFITENHYRQLMSCYTTDNKTCIDHTYTNRDKDKIQAHNAVYALINGF